jgi:hypothetical protein
MLRNVAVQADIWQPNYATKVNGKPDNSPASDPIPAGLVSFQSPTLTHLAAKLAVESSDDGAHTMPQNESNTPTPEPVKDEKPVDD